MQKHAFANSGLDLKRATDLLHRSRLMAGIQSETADQLNNPFSAPSAPAQPFKAGSRPVDWLQANRAWRTVGQTDEPSLPQTSRADQSM